MSKTVILIPCYNEELTIRKVVEDFHRELPDAEIYVYDNNSSDDTANIAAEAGAIVRHEPRQGKGNVVRSMFRDIEADCYIISDGDDTYPAAFAPVLQREVLEGRADMAIGDRLSSTYFDDNKRRFHGSGNKLVRSLVNSLFDANLNDIMTGARAFSRDFVKSFAVLARGFEIETEMTIFALDNNFKISEIPIEYRDRPEGSESKLSTYIDGRKVLATIAKLFRDTKPLAFFSWISLILLIVFLIFFIPILSNYFTTGLVAKFPTLIMASGILVVAIICFFSGLVLSVLRKQSHESFERELTIVHSLEPIGDMAKDAANRSKDQ